VASEAALASEAAQASVGEAAQASVGEAAQKNIATPSKVCHDRHLCLTHVCLLVQTYLKMIHLILKM
jgi:hypothetical protein